MKKLVSFILICALLLILTASSFGEGFLADFTIPGTTISVQIHENPNSTKNYETFVICVVTGVCQIILAPLNEPYSVMLSCNDVQEMLDAVRNNSIVSGLLSPYSNIETVIRFSTDEMYTIENWATAYSLLTEQ